MSGSREILNKINSIKSTQKITRAMELVATSKMRKACERLNSSKPYVSCALDIISQISRANLSYTHPYFKHRELKNIGLIVIATDCGLCGGLNINLFKEVLKSVEYYKNKDIKTNLFLIGAKSENFFKRLQEVNIVSILNFKDTNSINSVIGAASLAIQSFDKGEIDKLVLCGNNFVSKITQTPYQDQLLPILKCNKNTSVLLGKEVEDKKFYWDYLYEPDSNHVLDLLLARYIESRIHCGIVENLACEQAARMLAMKNATDNASDIIDSLRLEYNKTRQSMITQELAEIISGGAAV